MSKTLVLLWLGTSAPQATHETALDSWSRARWVQLAPPAEASPEGLIYDDALVSKIDEWLEQARLAASSLDDAAARERLAEVEGALRQHPALPQAAWLMAESLHVEATIAARAAPADRPKLLARAAALEGRRAPAFGEPGDPTAPTSTLSKIAVRGMRSADQLYFDGVPVARRLEIVTGEHHVRVLRRQRVVWAGWVSVAGSGDVTLPVGSPVACSLDDLEGVSLRMRKVVVPTGVGCERWAVARPAARGGIEIASCRGSECGPLMVWKAHYGAIYQGPPQPPPEPGFPAWATWALAGAGAAVLTTGVLWQAGAFDEPEPGATRFVFNGPGQQQKLGASPSAFGRR